MPSDPVVLPLSATRSITIAWTQRAVFRLGELRPPPQLADLKTAEGFGFLVKHLWVCLADADDRRRFPTPEDLANEMPEDELLLRPLWKAMWAVAFRFDPDAPAAEQADDVEKSDGNESPAAPAAELTQAQKKSAGAGSSPSPSLNSA